MHRCRRVHPVAAVTLAVALIALTGPAAPASTRTTGRQQDNGSLIFSLVAVTSLSPTDVWAAGFAYHDPGNGHEASLALHWDGAAWSRVRTPTPGSAELHGIAAAASNDVWAVGYSFGRGSIATLIEHWNGAEWIQVPSPNPGAAYNVLNAVSVVSSHDAWAVGQFAAGASRGRYRTLTLHWNGNRWSRVASPNPGPIKNSLFGVAADAHGDAWAVGDFHPQAHSAHAQTLVLHWDGGTWTQVAAPNPGSNWNGLASVAATSPRHAWSVGAFRGAARGRLTLNERWNGTAWTQVFGPNPGPSRNWLNGVSATSPTDVWEVGDYYTSEGTGSPNRSLIVHWDGASWTQVPSPNPSRVYNVLRAVSADAADDAWAVGYRWDPASNHPRSFVVRWDGVRWRTVRSPH